MVTNQAGMLMFQKALEKEAKRQLPAGKGLWQQLDENPNKAQYKELTLDSLEKAIGHYLSKPPKKRIRRKMKKKNGKII